ncbi:Fur-regulated basic protein FbpA [Metabacillus malikii]|uniref:Fur-regulated basic protein FbpA n=1 Tax=Metabacillus malikii TaxID=1504265 RepID=A0ABT9ZKZ9_9BACI|nr:Fur-regulated basic protein FbpA [Metabacillus malikii]MDQ0232564.1 hypothetical protein [Metabacillus malikii]
MSTITTEMNANKGDIIEILLNMNLYKMPDGRQLYEASEKELKNILNTYAYAEGLC